MGEIEERAEIDTSNKYLVGSRGNGVVVISCGLTLSANDAMNLAAWLVSVAQINTDVKFDDVLKAIQNC